MKKKLMIIGMCIWIPIWIFSYTPLAKQILNPPENWMLGLGTIILMLIGTVLMFIGMFKKDS